jgi:7,8-dihydropterin-6-yl-methyl-4-(beta-D-ribofuranosyl)aminobenzene 5'-phosphate synthase
MDKTINTLNRVQPQKVLLSAHDSCDTAIKTMEQKLESQTEVLKAGATYRF